jgi:L-asparaginase
MLAAVSDLPPIAAVRPVRIVAAGGTIAMSGEHARPALAAEDLVAAVPGLGSLRDLEVSSHANLPGAHMTLADTFGLAREAIAGAEAGRGVVVTHGTDTLEESAYLCDLLYDGDPPIVFTGAIRPASTTGADGPANLLDAVAVAGSAAATGLGVVVSFGGEIHAARSVRKVDSTSPVPFGSPQAGPIGRIDEGRPTFWARPTRHDALPSDRLDGRVPILTAAIGEDGALARAALASGVDGVVAVALGAGHLPPPMLKALSAAPVPVVATSRSERGSILRSTYGFEGSEADLRAAGIVAAGLLSPAAARIKLLACLGAGLDRSAIAAAFAPDDG